MPYEGQKSGQSQRIDYAGGIGRTNTWPPQDVPPDAKVVQNFQDKSRAKYMEELPETCQLSAYTALNLSMHSTTHYESAMYIKGSSLPGLLPLVLNAPGEEKVSKYTVAAGDGSR